jgi:PBP1b-binding outer membrane lipoprotein LpoB
MKWLAAIALAACLLTGCSGDAATVEGDPAGTTTGAGENSPEATSAFENYGEEDK